MTIKILEIEISFLIFYLIVSPGQHWVLYARGPGRLHDPHAPWALVTVVPWVPPPQGFEHVSHFHEHELESQRRRRRLRLSKSLKASSKINITKIKAYISRLFLLKILSSLLYCHTHFIINGIKLTIFWKNCKISAYHASVSRD